MPPRKIGDLGRLIGLACLVGLVIAFVTLPGMSSWGHVHNDPGMYFLSLAALAMSVLWLPATLLAAAIRRQAVWRPGELVLVVAIAVALTLAVMAWAGTS